MEQGGAKSWGHSCPELPQPGTVLGAGETSGGKTDPNLCPWGGSHGNYNDDMMTMMMTTVIKKGQLSSVSQEASLLSAPCGHCSLQQLALEGPSKPVQNFGVSCGQQDQVWEGIQLP